MEGAWVLEVVSGVLDLVEESSGRGVPSWGYALGGPRVGSSPGAQRRGVVWLSLPRAGRSVESLLLSIGVFVEGRLRPPISWKLAVDGVSVSRELKPQFVVETDQGVYMKAIYDVKPILSRRVLSQEDHRVVVVRDAVHSIRVADVFMYARFANEKARYSVSYRTGAVALEPGEVYKVDANLGTHLGGERRAGVIVHSPYHDAVLELVAGGSRPEATVGQGSFFVEARVPYRGSPIPVSVKYRDPGYRFYPRVAVVSEAIVYEVVAPEPRPRLVVSGVERVDESRVRVRGYVENEGGEELVDAMIVAIAVGVRLARRRIRRVGPGERVEYDLLLDLSRLPIRPSRASVRLIWRSLGKTRLEAVEVGVPG